MSCSNCYKFNNTKSSADLGDISDENSCAYCLYWYAGPGTERDDCPCDDTFEDVSYGGTKFDINSFNTVNSCLKTNQTKCQRLYTQFNNPPMPTNPDDVQPHFGSSYQQPKRFRDFGKESYIYGSLDPCTGKDASPGFSNEGVL